VEIGGFTSKHLFDVNTFHTPEQGRKPEEGTQNHKDHYPNPDNRRRDGMSTLKRFQQSVELISGYRGEQAELKDSQEVRKGTGKEAKELSENPFVG
jgi:hypothetical protein